MVGLLLVVSIGAAAATSCLEQSSGSCSADERYEEQSETLEACPRFKELEAASNVSRNLHTDRMSTEPTAGRSLESWLGNLGLHAVYAVRKGQLFRFLGSVVKEQGEVTRNPDTIESAIMRSIARFSGQFPDSELVLQYGDQPFFELNANIDSNTGFVPKFAFSPFRGEEVQLESVGFPNPYFLCDGNKLSKAKGASSKPWKERQGLAMFRGSMTVMDDLLPEQLASQSRVRLLEISRSRPDLFDVAFTSLDHGAALPEKTKEELTKLYDAAKQADIVRMAEAAPAYKYNINVNGVSVSWRGSSLLASGSAMLLQDSQTGEFFTRDLQPWKHFLPVKADLSDLASAVEHLQRHDDQAARIGKAGQDFYHRYLTNFATDCYILQAFLFAMQFPVVPRTFTEHDLINYGFELAPKRGDGCHP